MRRTRPKTRMERRAEWHLFTPFFWTTCDVCGKQVRMERMWARDRYTGIYRIRSRVCTICSVSAPKP